MSKRNFPFAIEAAYIPVLAVFGVLPTATSMSVGPDSIDITFGLLKRSIALDNIKSVKLTGPYKWYRAIGARYSYSDHGLTYGTSTAGGVCMEFHEGIEGHGPFKLVRHPNLTVTPVDLEGFAKAIKA